MNFSVTDYRKAVADYCAKWCVIDAELYSLCRRYPDHSNVRGMNAKLWIIGRTYATGIERKISTQWTQGSSLTQLSDHLATRARTVDRIIETLAGIAEPLTPENLRTIVDCHGQFLRILNEITREGQTVRSFASKYLHFHCPAVPIIDSYVSGILPRLVRWRSELQVFATPTHGDESYAWYVMRFWNLYQSARAALLKHGRSAGEDSLCVKHLDYYLIWLSGQAF